MKYQLNPENPWQLNGTLIDNGDDTSTQPIIINPCIIDGQYGFFSPAPSKNMLSVIIPNKGLDIDALKAKCQSDAESFDKAQSPDTN